MTTRVLIIDDHAVLRAGLHAWLNSVADLEVIGEGCDGVEAIRLAEQLHPDVVLMDISLPSSGGGIDATRRLRELMPQARVLMLTVHEDDDLLREAIQAGASGYLVKRTVQTELVDAIRAVARGDMYIHPSMTRGLLKEIGAGSTGDADSHAPAGGEPEAEPLTPREIEVARLISQGYTSKEIAQELCISVRTVEFHRTNLMGKLGLRSRVELMRYVESRGWSRRSTKS